MHEEAIFAGALMKAPGAERQAFLEQACGGDVALRQRLEQLLAADGQAGGVLERGPDVAVLNPAPPEPPLAADRVFAGRFKLRQKLGEGGMGEVWVADQTEPVRRRVALKVVRSGLDSARLLARFDQERQALALMDHPNIAKVLDAGVDEAGRPYFAMELIEGVPITKYCDEARLSPAQRLELFLPVCHAVQHAHQKGVIHRDLKPSNLLVALYDGRPVLKVIDFGVAKATGPRLTEQSIDTEVGSLIGTLEYMSPEQAELNNLDVDTRADIYSLGVVLYELLTGTVPFPRRELQGAPFTEMLRIIREAEPPKPSTRLSNSETLPSVAAARRTESGKLITLVRGELDWIILKCLEKDRARRYQTANGLARDIERYLHEEPLEAGPPSGVYRLRKFARRHKRRLAFAAGVFLAVTVMAASIGWAVRDRAAQQAEIEQAETTRRTKVEAQVRDSLNLARALIAENRLASARARLAQARAQLGNDGPALGNLAAEVEAGAAELDRFQQFLDLIERAHEAEAVTLGPGMAIPSKAWARRFTAAVPLRLEALKCYGILERDDWYSALGAGFLGKHQVEQIRQLTYEELLWLADDVIRRQEGHPSEEKLSPNAAAHEALAYLGKAENAHRPTRALYVLRARCRKTLVGEEAAQADTQRAAQTSATIALDHFLEGRAAYDAKQLAEGIQAFEAALRLDPTHYWSLMWLGFCLYDLGQGPADFAGAARVFTGCILKRPDHSFAYSARAACYLKLRRYADVVADCSRAIELDPKLVPAWTGRGLAYWQLRQRDNALADLSRAIELDPKHAPAWNNRGLVYNKLGQPTKALADLSRAIELDPKLVPTWTERGIAYWELGQRDNALADFSRAIELDAKNARAWTNRGLAYNKLGQQEKALVDLSRAIELDPTSAPSWGNRGLAYWRLGQRDNALADFSRAVELDPKLMPAWLNRGELYAQLGQPDKAVADLSRAIELAPNDPRLVEAYRLRALTHRRLGHFAQARTDYETFLRRAPARAEAHNDLAWLLATCPDAKLREPHRAVELAQKAVQLAPKDGDYWSTVGVAYYRADDWKNAVTALEKSLELSPEESVADNGFFLAMSHWKLGDKEQARQWYGKAAASMEKNRPTDGELLQFRAEASSLLGLRDTEGPGKKDGK
jgi:tetratricopeptide (TPR) repeat protein/serine/threonine protein kinase